MNEQEETFSQYSDRMIRTGRAYEVWIDQKKNVDAERWCRTHFGQRWSLGTSDGVWACFWGGPDRHNEYRFNFSRQADAVVFALKFGCA